MMSFEEARQSGMLLYATVEDAYHEREIDEILIREAAKAHPGVQLAVKTVRHKDRLLADHGDYIRAVFEEMN